MSLDIWLNVMETRQVFDANITHNLNSMADAAGLYDVMWRPDENGIKKAKDAIPHLEAGIEKLQLLDQAVIDEHTPQNGWGTYGGLLRTALAYLKACYMHPEAEIRVWR